MVEMKPIPKNLGPKINIIKLEAIHDIPAGKGGNLKTNWGHPFLPKGYKTWITSEDTTIPGGTGTHLEANRWMSNFCGTHFKIVGLIMADNNDNVTESNFSKRSLEDIRNSLGHKKLAVRSERDYILAVNAFINLGYNPMDEFIKKGYHLETVGAYIDRDDVSMSEVSGVFYNCNTRQEISLEYLLSLLDERSVTTSFEFEEDLEELIM